jgi:hypothetical protein
MAVIRDLVFVYRLRDDHDEIFYVGRTCDPEKRLDQNRRRFGYCPTMEFLEIVPRAYGKWAERDLIEFHLLGGHRLINLMGVNQRLWARVGDITYPLKRARQCWRLRTVEEMRLRAVYNRPVGPEEHFPGHPRHTT